MPASEFYEWMAMESVEPFGDRRGDVQSAVVASTIANVNRGKSKAFEVSQFMPNWEQKPKAVVPQTTEEQLAFWTALQASQNAKVNNG
jgi:hypothetical protein